MKIMKLTSVTICLLLLGNVFINGSVCRAVAGDNGPSGKVSVDELKSIANIALTMNTLVREQVMQFMEFTVNFGDATRPKNLPDSKQNTKTIEFIPLINAKNITGQSSLLIIFDGAHKTAWHYGISVSAIICILSAFLFIRKRRSEHHVRMLARGSIAEIVTIISNIVKKSLISYRLMRDFYFKAEFYWFFKTYLYFRQLYILYRA